MDSNTPRTVEAFDLKTYSDGSTNYTVEQFTHKRIDGVMYDSSVSPPLERYIVDGKTYYTVWSVVRPRPYETSPHREVYYYKPNNVLTAVYQITADNNPIYYNAGGYIEEAVQFPDAVFYTPVFN